MMIKHRHCYLFAYYIRKYFPTAVTQTQSLYRITLLPGNAIKRWWLHLFDTKTIEQYLLSHSVCHFSRKIRGRDINFAEEKNWFFIVMRRNNKISTKYYFVIDMVFAICNNIIYVNKNRLFISRNIRKKRAHSLRLFNNCFLEIGEKKICNNKDLNIALEKSNSLPLLTFILSLFLFLL